MIMETFLSIVFIAIITWIFLNPARRKPRHHDRVIKTELPASAHSNHDDAANEEQYNYERFNYYEAHMRPAEGRYHIIYTDERGLTTERDISVEGVYDNNGKFAIDAHCHLRNSHRSFIDEWIQNAVDLDTGEFVESVAQHAIAQHENSEEEKLRNAIEREIMALHLLVFISRADGRMMKAERMIIADYLKRQCQDIVLDSDEFDEAIKAISTIDRRDFKRIIADMKSAGDIERLRDITDCAKRIVATQKTIEPLEKTSLEILEAATNP